VAWIVVAALIAPAAGRAEALKADADTFQARITAELAEKDPAAAALFIRANEARDRRDLDVAADLYGQVMASAPWFTHAERRLCGVEGERKHFDRAVSLCREVVAKDASALNEGALADTLARTGNPEHRAEAARLAYSAARRAPDDVAVQGIACQVGLNCGSQEILAVCAANLGRLAPDDMGTLAFTAVEQAIRGDIDEAEATLDRAEAKGMPAEASAQLRASFEDARSPVDRWGRRALRVLVVWLLGFGLLFAVGALLSRATLRAIEAHRPESESSAGLHGHARGAEGFLRRVYRLVVTLTCAYYYLSLPIVMGIALVTCAGLIYVLLAMGQVPIKLVLIALVIAGGSVWAIVKGLFVRRSEGDPGVRLDLEAHPELRAVLHEVASKIETRPVDAVYLTPGTEVAVFERGAILKQIRGASERCLVLGAGVLEGMTVREFKSILAHEYGHFRNEDTAGGGLALAVRASLLTTAVHLARLGPAAVRFNPTWWFLRAFQAVFLRVSQGASRLQEVLADRWAAALYGSEAFARGLEHVVQTSVRFDARVSATLRDHVESKRPLANLYATPAADPSREANLAQALEAAMRGPASPYDSHPKPAIRIEWVRRIAAPGAAHDPRDAREAWELLASREVLQRQMTDIVRANLARRGIHLARMGEAPPAA
jgi:Zn-dependent protease with chaperone function